MPPRPLFPRVLILILLSTLFLAVASAGQVPSNSDATLKQLSLQAQEAQRRGDYRGAAVSYQQMLKLRPNQAEVRVNLGLMHHLLGEYSEAIQNFEAALRAKPQLFVPNLFLGLDLLQLRQARRALTYLRRAYEQNPRDEQATLGLGQAYAALREFEKANGWYFRATQINPQSTDARYGLGLTYLNLAQSAAKEMGKADLNSVYSQILLAESILQQGHLGDAITIYRKLLDAESAPPGLHAALGFAYVRQGEISAAEGEFQAELKDHPGYLLARLGLARVSIGRGDLVGALSELEQAWKADRNFVEANAPHLWLSLDLIRAHEWVRRLRELRASEPQGALVNFLITTFERWQQNPIEASTWARKPSPRQTSGSHSSYKASPEDRKIATRLYSQGDYTQCAGRLEPQLNQLPLGDLLVLAQCAYYSGDYRASFLASGELVRANPQDAPGLYWRVKAGQKLAISALVRAGLAEPNSARVHVLLAEAYREMDNLKEAVAEYRLAIELKPNDLAAHLGLATTYWRVFDFDKALPELQKVLELNPADPEASYLLGQNLVSRHQYAEAVPYLKNALNGTPSTVPHVHAFLGKVYAAQGQTAKAVGEYKQALAEDHNGSYHYQLYQLYKKLGDQEAATAALQKSEALRRSQLERERARFMNLP